MCHVSCDLKNIDRVHGQQVHKVHTPWINYVRVSLITRI